MFINVLDTFPCENIDVVSALPHSGLYQDLPATWPELDESGLYDAPPQGYQDPSMTWHGEYRTLCSP